MAGIIEKNDSRHPGHPDYSKISKQREELVALQEKIIAESAAAKAAEEAAKKAADEKAAAEKAAEEAAKANQP